MSLRLAQGLLFGDDGRAAYRPPAAHDRVGRDDRGRAVRQTLRSRVLDALATGPKTDEELCAVTRLRGSSVRPRRLELLRAGVIEDSGQVRPTRAGREAIVWRLRSPGDAAPCRSS